MQRGRGGGHYRPEGGGREAPWGMGENFSDRFPEKDRAGGKELSVCSKVGATSHGHSNYMKSLEETRGNRRMKSDLHSEGQAGYNRINGMDSSHDRLIT